MNITFLDPDISTWIQRRVIPLRSSGPHVSTVLVGMLKEAMPRQYATYTKVEDGARVPAFEAGYLWEDALATALAARIHLEPSHRLMPPQEITRDGIHGTPDRVLWDSARDRWIVEELKATWYSSGELEVSPQALMNNRKFTYWTLQAKTYAAMLLHHWPNTERIQSFEDGGIILRPSLSPIARIRALFVNGNYKRSQNTDTRAQPLCWEIDWTPTELDDWWAAVRRYVDRTTSQDTSTQENQNA